MVPILHVADFELVKLTNFDEPKNRKNSCGSKLAFKQVKVIAVYIVQNETMVVFLELFKQAKFF